MKNVDYVIRILKLDLEINTTRQDFRLQEYIKLAAMRTPMATGEYAVEVKECRQNEAGIIPFPADLEDFITMSVRVCGKWLALSVNEELSVTQPLSPCSYYDLNQVLGCKASDLNMINFPDALSVAPHYRNGILVGEAYTMTTGFNPHGYVNVDKKKRQFRIEGVPRVCTLQLQYYADKSFGPMTPIKDSSVDFLRYSVRKQMEESASGDLKRAQYFSVEQLKAFHDMAFNEHVPPLDQLLDNMRAGSTTLIKR